MGDQSKPEMFMSNFHHCVKSWISDSYASHSKPMIARDLFNCPQDTSVGSFLDDLVKVIVMPAPKLTLAEVNYIDHQDNQQLDERLSERGYTQNTGKQDTIPSFPNRQMNHRFIRSMRDKGRSAASTLKHLGAIHSNAHQGCAAEAEARLRALNIGWRNLAHFWFSKSPWATNRFMFMSVVFTAALSAAESVVWSTEQARKLCSALSQKN